MQKGDKNLSQTQKKTKRKEETETYIQAHTDT
ncbi:hypothetical protein LINGRAHAP2_LOCUS30965, partial [Linum grandiflorum]